MRKARNYIRETRQFDEPDSVWSLPRLLRNNFKVHLNALRNEARTLAKT